MTYLVAVFFAALTLLTGYLTYNNVGLAETSYASTSVRQNSIGSGSGSGGSSGFRYGK